jgi:hypothetical protein
MSKIARGGRRWGLLRRRDKISAIRYLPAHDALRVMFLHREQGRARHQNQVT